MPDTIKAGTRISAPCAVCKIDLKGRFVYIDDETEELLGLTREELFGKSIYGFISEASHQILDTVLGNHNRYESFYQSLSLDICARGKAVRPFEAVVTLNFISGNPVNYQIILIPSVVRQPVESSVSPGEQLTMLGQIDDGFQTGIAVYDGEFDIVFFNREFGGIFDNISETGQRVNLKALWDKRPLHGPDGAPLSFNDSPMARAVKVQALQAGTGRAAGNTLYSIQAAPMPSESSSLYVVRFVPESDRSSQSASLEKTYRRLIASAAHDLRAPLITIEAFAKKMRNSYSDRLDTDGKFIAECLIENATLLQKMVDGLGEMSRNRLTSVTPEEVPVGKMIGELVDFFRAAYPHVHHTVQIGGDLPTIAAPKRKLTQVFRGILDNAFKYSAGEERPMITISHKAAEGNHQFSISDNGPGISEEYRDKVFDLFFRIPETSALPGTGMGLTIAADIVAGWGGRLWVEDTPEPGSRISFTLPYEIRE